MSDPGEEAGWAWSTTWARASVEKGKGSKRKFGLARGRDWGWVKKKKLGARGVSGWVGESLTRERGKGGHKGIGELGPEVGGFLLLRSVATWI